MSDQDDLLFADVNNRTVEQTRKALQTQSAIARFIEKHQGKPAAELQREFGALLNSMIHAPLPAAGGDEADRMPQENRPHE